MLLHETASDLTDTETGNFPRLDTKAEAFFAMHPERRFFLDHAARLLKCKVDFDVHLQLPIPRLRRKSAAVPFDLDPLDDSEETGRVLFETILEAYPSCARLPAIKHFIEVCGLRSHRGGRRKP